ncbi:zinc finger CCCH domain-containing protein 7B [Salmo trutta]|uniref:zinc finger CCCH domain-containing protein 7B n=1 Tax=Salmo trutta TaxID=8032 RepID=UPI001131EC1B|nr:zinc finger CCCH domain-containing protein 7B-like [Salmo trutta]
MDRSTNQTRPSSTALLKHDTAWVLLVKSFEKKKWVVVRPLPFSRAYPQQYDKCHYIGNCSFAHSLEDRDVWTYMKNNSLRDMQQMYDMWLRLTSQNRITDAGPVSGGEMGFHDDRLH